MDKARYKEYLKSPHWLEIKKALYSNNPSCKFCNKKTMLNIHHLTYERLGKERLEDLILLCRTCHFELHKKMNIPALDWVQGKRMQKTKRAITFGEIQKHYSKLSKSHNYSLVLYLIKKIKTEELAFNEKRQLESIKKLVENKYRKSLKSTSVSSEILT